MLRRADWLTADRVLAVLRVMAMVQICVAAFWIATAKGAVDRNGLLLGTDFLSFWTTGRMIALGQSPYDVAAHIAGQRAFFAAEGSHVGFFYPPNVLPFFAPLGHLSYLSALALWVLATGAAFYAACAGWAREIGLSRFGPIALLGFPAAWLTLYHGQTSCLVAALLGGGMLLVRRHPWAAGLLFGLATIKPQFGLLIPIVLLATLQWRVIGGAILGALALAAVATVMMGWEVWPAWYGITENAGRALRDGQIGFAKLQSVYAALRLIGWADGLAMAIQVAVGLSVAAALAWAGWRTGWSLTLGAATLVGTLSTTPFALDYDFVLLAFPILFLAQSPYRPWAKIVAASLFAAPHFARVIGLEFGVPILAPLNLALFAVLMARLKAEGLPRHSQRRSLAPIQTSTN